MAAVLVWDRALRYYAPLTLRHHEDGSVTFTALAVGPMSGEPTVTVQAEIDGAAEPMHLVFHRDEAGAWTTRSVAGEPARVFIPDELAGWLDRAVEAAQGVNA